MMMLPTFDNAELVYPYGWSMAMRQFLDNATTGWLVTVPEDSERAFFVPASCPETSRRPVRRPVLDVASSMGISDWLDSHNVPDDAR